ncbi:unnamed protein product, partial [marine sediment metagenome]
VYALEYKVILEKKVTEKSSREVANIPKIVLFEYFLFIFIFINLKLNFISFKYINIW